MKDKIKKIVNIHRFFIDEYIGGTTVYNLGLCSHIANKNVEIHHIVGTRDKNKLSYEKWQSFHLHRIYLPFSNPVLNFVYRLYKTRMIVRKLNSESKIDVIFFHEGGLAEFLKYDSKLRKIPQVYFFHAPHFHEILYDFDKIKKDLKGAIFLLRWLKTKIYSIKFKIMEKESLKFAKKIITDSEYDKLLIKKFYNCKKNVYKKTEVIPIGIDINIYTPPKDKTFLKKEIGVKDKIVFFALRRLEPRMGLKNLILAFKGLSTEFNDKIILFIGGKGLLQKQLGEMVKELSLEKYIKFLGFLRESDKVKYLQLADAVIVPSEDLEGFGIINIEALACNTPVIGTKVGAIPEILNYISPELIVPNSSPEELKKKMQFFIANIKDYRERAKSFTFSDFTKEKYSWNNISSRILDSINNIL